MTLVRIGMNNGIEFIKFINPSRSNLHYKVDILLLHLFYLKPQLSHLCPNSSHNVLEHRYFTYWIGISFWLSAILAKVFLSINFPVPKLKHHPLKVCHLIIPQRSVQLLFVIPWDQNFYQMAFA